MSAPICAARMPIVCEAPPLQSGFEPVFQNTGD
jgi:hypothetical protein